MRANKNSSKVFFGIRLNYCAGFILLLFSHLVLAVEQGSEIERSKLLAVDSAMSELLTNTSSTHLSFNLIAEAELAATELRSTGKQVNVVSVKVMTSLKTLRLGKYISRAEAQKVLDTLLAQDIPSFVIEPDSQKSCCFSLAVGAFSNKIYLRQRYDKLKELGFSEISILSIQVPVKKYIVVNASFQTPVPIMITTENIEHEVAYIKDDNVVLNDHLKPPNLVVENDVVAVLESISTDDYFMFGDVFGDAVADDTSSVSGFFQNETAYAFRQPEHLSKVRNVLELGDVGRFSNGIQWKMNGRLIYDAVFSLDDYFPDAVKDDQQLQFDVREAYLDFSKGNWDFRVGRQNIIWGEVVGLYFADVVSAKDLREPARPELDMLRIPQWATRAEYFKGDYHLDMIWLPYMTYNDIGKVGAEFYPAMPAIASGFTGVLRDDLRPDDNLSNSAYGLRLSYQGASWDSSVFYYNSLDTSPAMERIIRTSPSPEIIIQPIHGRISQLGMTFSQDFGFAVLKSEAVFSKDKLFNVSRLSDADGLVEQNTLDYIVSLEFSFAKETRLNIQYFELRLNNPDVDLVIEDVEQGSSFILSTQAIDPDIEAEMFLVYRLNRDDWFLRPKLTWQFSPDWHLAFGAEHFSGPAASAFGQYDNRDRYFSELRYSF